MPRKCPHASRRRLPRASRLSGHALPCSERPRASVALRGAVTAAPAGAVRPRRPWVRRAGQSPRREGLTPRRPWRDRHPRSVQGGFRGLGRVFRGQRACAAGGPGHRRGVRGGASDPFLPARAVGGVGGGHMATADGVAPCPGEVDGGSTGRALGVGGGGGTGGDPRVGDGVGVPATRAGGPRSHRIGWSFPHRGTAGTLTPCCLTVLVSHNVSSSSQLGRRERGYGTITGEKR